MRTQPTVIIRIPRDDYARDDIQWDQDHTVIQWHDRWVDMRPQKNGAGLADYLSPEELKIIAPYFEGQRVPASLHTLAAFSALYLLMLLPV